jgi:cyanophycinase
MALQREPGTLIVIGGAENKDGNPEILEFVADRVGTGPLVVMTCATEDPEAAWRGYRKVFRKLGVKKLEHVDVRDRERGLDPALSEPIERARGVFFTGGDQLRITSHIGATPVYERIRGLLERGGVVAGTSAGASVMSDTMLVSGEGRNTPRIGEAVVMAPGLGFLSDAIIDMHFSERGRIGRLLGAIAQNPRTLGIGIDEDTAMAVHADCAEIIGSGGVWFVDGASAGSSNVAEGAEDETLSIENVVLHVLGAGRRFDLANRRPA